MRRSRSARVWHGCETVRRLSSTCSKYHYSFSKCAQVVRQVVCSNIRRPSRRKTTFCEKLAACQRDGSDYRPSAARSQPARVTQQHTTQPSASACEGSAHGSPNRTAACQRDWQFEEGCPDHCREDTVSPVIVRLPAVCQQRAAVAVLPGLFES